MKDDPTEPIRPSASRQQDQQGNKLVLGNFQDAQKHAQRKPYQYPPQPPQYHGQRPQVWPAATANQQAPNAPAVNPEAQPYPYHQQPGQTPGVSKTPAHQGRRVPLRRRGCLIGCLVVLLLSCVLSIFTFTTAQRVLAFGSAISTQSPLSTQTGYMGTSDRVNLLVMGFGGGNHDGAYLTDSMVVMSLLPPSHHITLVSVPRDLWVQIPPGSGQYHKINTAYEFGSNNNANPAAGSDAAAAKVSLVTGLDVKYWLTINFQGFRDFINAIGGIDVYVPDS